MLSDIRMPGMGGTELAARAHKLYPGLSILLMTGYAHNGHPFPVLNKPFRLHQMADMVRATLAG